MNGKWQRTFQTPPPLIMRHYNFAVGVVVCTKIGHEFLVMLYIIIHYHLHSSPSLVTQFTHYYIIFILSVCMWHVHIYTLYICIFVYMHVQLYGTVSDSLHTKFIEI